MICTALSLLKIQFDATEGRDKQRAAWAISRGSTFIAMMQAANLREGNNVIACAGSLYRTRPWTVLVERKMRSRVMMILEIARQHTAQVTLAEEDKVIQAFSADRSDETLGVGVLPGLMTSVMPIARTRWRKAGPYDLSRSRSR